MDSHQNQMYEFACEGGGKDRFTLQFQITSHIYYLPEEEEIHSL